MMDALHRMLTGQTLTRREIQIAGAFIIIWFTMDLIQFADFVIGKIWP